VPSSRISTCTPTPGARASSFAEAPGAAIRACVEHGLEGVVLKHRESKYVPGKRSRHWVELKTSTWRTDHAELRHER
jgi:ATP-dependent DNA ligase